MDIKEVFSEKETFELGKLLGKKAKAKDVFCLIGDLGVGKTVFTKGFAAGLEINEDINSPTFMIVQEYIGRMPFFHFDVYRIHDVEELYEIGFEEYIHGEGVCLIEWANLIKDIIPKDNITIKIEKDINISFEYRKITIEGEINI